MGTQIADTLLNKGVSCDEFKALHLSKVGFLATHVDEQ